MKYSFLALIFTTFTFNLFAQDSLSFAEKIVEFRKEYKQDFLDNERSPLQTEEALEYLRFYDINEKYVVEAVLTLTPDAKPFEMSTYSGNVQPYQKYGVFTFELNGKKQELSIYQSLRLAKIAGFKEYLFLPFRDLTNGETTYGGGRYIDFKISDIVEGKMMLDFNKCYNPWCHYSEGYNCPIPPKENNLEVEILAGEQNYGKESGHH